MGLYIDPPDMSKEDFLKKHGTQTTLDECKMLFVNGQYKQRLPVCLVNNGSFTAAGIADTAGELGAFAYPDGRPKKWYIVAKEHLAPYMRD
jgi:hypothetical protein